LLTRLPVGLLALLLLVLPSAPVARVAATSALDAARVTLERTDLTPAPRASAVGRSPLFDDLPGAAPTPLAIAAVAPDIDDEGRLRAAVAAALPLLGGQASTRWGTPSAVGPVLEVRWQPQETLDAPPAVQHAVERVVGTVVGTADKVFPAGFRTGEGTPLAAVRVLLPAQDDVLVAVRTYREYAAGDSTPEEFARQWRLLRREGTEARPAPPTARLLPQGPSEGAPERWPPRVARWHAEILHAAYTYQIDPAVLAAVMQQESGGDPYATGAWAWIPHMGRYERAIGLMQVMPNEAERRGVPIDEAWDVDSNILLGARVLRDKLTVIRGDFWTRVQGYYGFGDPLSDYWLDRVYANWLAFREPRTEP
jgi:hypothetical protein